MEERLQNLKNQLILDLTNIGLIYDYFKALERAGVEETFQIGDIVLVDDNLLSANEVWNPVYLWAGMVYQVDRRTIWIKTPSNLTDEGRRIEYLIYPRAPKCAIVINSFDSDELLIFEQDRLFEWIRDFGKRLKSQI